MPKLRLVPAAGDTARSWVADGRPRVSLRLLMAASGRCSCDDCLLAYRAGDRNAGIIRARVGAHGTAASRPALVLAR
jgi:hypothetical protein